MSGDPLLPGILVLAVFAGSNFISQIFEVHNLD